LAPGAGLDPRDAAGQLRSFGDVLKHSTELRTVLLSPAVPASKKRAVVEALSAGAGINRLIRNFLFILVDRRRAGLLEELADAFEMAIDERLGLVRAQVTSALPLKDRQQTELQQSLSQLAGKQVRCEFKVDPALIGGVVARIGSTVYDGSVRTQIDSLRDRLVS
jgi:F-type H+-transporting ATPase subunit delta